MAVPERGAWQRPSGAGRRRPRSGPAQEPAGDGLRFTLEEGHLEVVGWIVLIK